MQDRVNPAFWLATQVGLQYIACLGKLIPFCEILRWIHVNGKPSWISSKDYKKILKSQSRIKGGSFVSTAGLYMNLRESK